MCRLPADGHAKTEIGESDHRNNPLQRKPQASISLAEHPQNERDGNDRAQRGAALLIPSGQNRGACRVGPTPFVKIPNGYHGRTTFLLPLNAAHRTRVLSPLCRPVWMTDKPAINFLNPAVQWDRWPPA